MKKKKASKISLFVAVIAIFLLALIVSYDYFGKEPVSANLVQNMEVNSNQGLENMINKIYSNDVKEDEPEKKNEVLNEIVENNKEENKKNEIDSSEVKLSREEKAIKMAKEKYGEQEGVYFSVDAIDSDGRYIVSVHESETTIMVTSYLIDVDKEKIEVQ